MFLGSNLVLWCAKRQPTVSRSSTEAEYRALAQTAAELTWINFLLRDNRISQSSPALLQCDNLSAVNLSANPVFHSRSKHFEVDYHYIRERVALGLVNVQHIPAMLQLADIFTKSLPRQAFQSLRSKLGVGNLQLPSLREGVRSMKQETQKMGLSIKSSPTQQGPSQVAPNTNHSKQSCSSTVLKQTKPAGEVVLHNSFRPLCV